MSHIAFPRLDPTILARRDAIVERPGGDPAARMPDRRRIRPPRVRDRRADRLSPPAARGRPAAHDRGGRAGPAALPRREGQCRAARRRHLALRRRDPAGGRGRHRAHQDEPHPRGQPRRPLCAGRGGRDQSRDLGSGRAGRLLLRARSVLAARLHDRRQYRHEFRRRALPQIRRHHQQPARRPARHLRRRDPRYRRRGDGRAGLRSCSASSAARKASSASSPRRPCASFRSPEGARPVLFGFDSVEDASAVRRRDHRRRHRSGRDGIHGQARRSTSARISPTPAIRSTSRRC